MILAPEWSFIYDASFFLTLPLPLMLYKGIFHCQYFGFVQNNFDWEDREEDTDISTKKLIKAIFCNIFYMQYIVINNMSTPIYSTKPTTERRILWSSPEYPDENDFW